MSENTHDNVLIADDLGCVRGERTVFANLGFRLESGGCLLLLGHNGSGKSSLLRMLAGFLRPHGGKIRFNDTILHYDREYSASLMQFVGHSDGIKLLLSVAENVQLWAKLHDCSDIESTTKNALERVDLEHLADEPARILSAGQRRRLALSRLLVASHPIWLLDEPTSVLDENSVASFKGIIAEHRSKGGMVILSTHSDLDLPDAKKLQLDEFSPDKSLVEVWE